MLYGVSVGPGDPELLTLKAARILQEADCIAIPNKGNGRRTALGIVDAYLEGKEIIDCATPMSLDRDVVLKAYRKIADDLCKALGEGKTVAYAVLGDATIYSTYAYIQDMVIADGYDAKIIPGVTSFCAAAAELGVALCEGPEQLLIIPAGKNSVEDALDYPSNKVIMKTGKSLGAVKEELDKRGLLETSSAVMNCGLEDEVVFPQLKEAEERSDYFCVVITKDPREQ